MKASNCCVPIIISNDFTTRRAVSVYIVFFPCVYHSLHNVFGSVVVL